MQDPLKQGLKHPSVLISLRYLATIRMQDPLKQGLKRVLKCIVYAVREIRMQDPLKQGLKHRYLHACHFNGGFECKIH